MEESGIIQNISLNLLNEIRNFPEISFFIKFLQGVGVIVLVYFFIIIILKIIQYRRLKKIPEIYDKLLEVDKRLERIESMLNKKRAHKK